jgi:MYXO-CTERM domain-containing protein
VFLQLHLVLGLLLGPLADRAFDQAKGPVVAAVAVLAAGALLFWRARRRNRAPAAWTEAACPACLGVRALAERVPGLTALVAGLGEAVPADPVGSGPDDRPKALAG